MGLELDEVKYHRGAQGDYQVVQHFLADLELPPPISQAAYSERLDHINDTFRFIGRPPVETAVVNPDKLSDRVILFPSTHFSSGSHNVGNMVELAARGAATPDSAIVYIAYPGNGGSQSLRWSERAHLASTGRFTRGDGTGKDPYRPLDSLEALAYTLGEHGLLNSRRIFVSGDESGARLGLGLMAALDRDSVQAAYLNGPPGVSHRASYGPAMLSEDARSRLKRHSKASLEATEPGEVVPARLHEARERLSTIYSGLGHVGVVAWTYLRAPVNVGASLAAFSGHDALDSPNKHALLQDTLAALERQDTSLTFQFNLGSSLHRATDCIQFGKSALAQLREEPRASRRDIRILLGRGSLDSHTEEPAKRLAAERYALFD